MKYLNFYALSVFMGLFFSSCKQDFCYCSADDNLSDEDVTLIASPTKSFSIGSVSFKMIGVKGGSFTMGGQKEDSTASDFNPYATASTTPHKVTLTSFYMGETEVRQDLWQVVAGDALSKTWSSYNCCSNNAPAFAISYTDAVNLFLPALNDTLHALGQLDDDWEFRLPTEAQWEYAARGGQKSANTYFAGSNVAKDVANYGSNTTTESRVYFHGVKTLEPNELGLYDMSGNVAEWCADYYKANFYSICPEVDPVCTDSSATHIIRGGGYSSSESYLSVISRRAITIANVSSVHSIYYGGMRLCLVHVKKTDNE